MSATKKQFELMETNTSLTAWGTSRAIRIPKRICDRTGIGIGSKLKVISGVDTDGAYITIRAAENHRSYSDVPYLSIDEIFSHYAGGHQPTEFDWGNDEGDEVVQ